MLRLRFWLLWLWRGGGGVEGDDWSVPWPVNFGTLYSATEDGHLIELLAGSLFTIGG
jgi:hypothetical protein